MPSPTPHRVAVHDPDRKGFLIPAAQLTDTPFARGDRFAFARGRQPMFTVTLIKSEKGSLVFDTNGIFIPRTRMMDALLGGIYDQITIDLDPAAPDRIRLTPLAENRPISNGSAK